MLLTPSIIVVYPSLPIEIEQTDGYSDLRPVTAPSHLRSAPQWAEPQGGTTLVYISLMIGYYRPHTGGWILH
jgi:hypothetical protein